jgi:hypothetical protein
MDWNLFLHRTFLLDFFKWLYNAGLEPRAPNKGDRCYHIMSRGLSARPSEIWDQRYAILFSRQMGHNICRNAS